MIIEKLRAAPIVPLINATDPNQAIATVKALHRGGLEVVEVVLRNDAALDCLAAIAEACPESFLGAGTVLSRAQCEDAVARGAQFIVSPGLDEAIVDLCKNRGLGIFPGTATATEMQKACNLGLQAVKFFPASLAGGPEMIKAVAGVFRQLSFMPTGGVSEHNLADYLAIDQVIACGGSWLTPAPEIAQGNYEAVTQLAQKAIVIAQNARAIK